MPRWKLRREGEFSPENYPSRGLLTAQAFWARNLNSIHDAESFLRPRLSELLSPFRLKNLEASSERLLKAVQNQENIVIYADYDVDGMSACSLLTLFLKQCGAQNVSHYIPHRFEEGYGVHVAAIEKLAQERSPNLLITVDNGITAIEAIAKANELKIDVILTDHHLPKEKLPETPYLINPNAGGDESGLGYLCGTGVAFYLSLGLLIKARESKHFEKLGIEVPKPKEFLDFFALATLADQMQLIGENRNLVKAGLEQLRTTRRPGLQVLLRECVDDLSVNLSARSVTFGVVPKLNAASRMGFAEKTLELLMAKDWNEAEVACRNLLDLNNKRVQMQAEVWEEAHFQAKEQDLAQAPVLIVKGKWHEGVLGIVAAKVVEAFAKPAIVLSENGTLLKGSMRTIPGFHCLRLLNAAQQHLLGFGGHEGAAGLQLDLNNFSLFQESVWQEALNFSNTENVVSEILFDGFWVPTHDENDFFMLEDFAPYGPANPEPLFCVKNLTIPSTYKVLKEKHLKWQDKASGIEFLAFNKSQEILKHIQEGNAQFDVLVTPEVNRFRGQARLQCRVEHVRLTIAENSNSRS